MRIPIARDAVVYLVGFGAAAILSFVFNQPGVTVFCVLMFVIVAFFFRDPERVAPEGDRQVLAPADGRVVQLRQDGEHRALSIFLSVLDVHVNRAPVSGRVERVTYHAGKFQAAFRHGASSDNERNDITIRSALGAITASQIAGVLARRIVCTLKPGDEVRAGQRIGLIKFGSRMDVTVPTSVTWTVRVGDRVRAGVTVIGLAGEQT